MSDYFGRNALAYLALRLRINWQSEIRMRLDVDEARRDGQPGYVDLSFGRAGYLADGCDAIVRNREVAELSGSPAAVIEGAATQDQVEAHVNPSSSALLRLHAGGADDRAPALDLCINVGLGLGCRTAAGLLTEGGELVADVG